MTIASTPRRRASRTIASPALRERIVNGLTVTPSYSSPTALACASATRARLRSPSGSRPSSAIAIGTSNTHIASICAPSSSSSSALSSAATARPSA